MAIRLLNELEHFLKRGKQTCSPGILARSPLRKFRNPNLFKNRKSSKLIRECRSIAHIRRHVQRGTDLEATVQSAWHSCGRGSARCSDWTPDLSLVRNQEHPGDYLATSALAAAAVNDQSSNRPTRLVARSSSYCSWKSDIQIQTLHCDSNPVQPAVPR